MFIVLSFFCKNGQKMRIKTYQKCLTFDEGSSAAACFSFEMEGFEPETSILLVLTQLRLRSNLESIETVSSRDHFYPDADADADADAEADAELVLT